MKKLLTSTFFFCVTLVDASQFGVRFTGTQLMRCQPYTSYKDDQTRKLATQDLTEAFDITEIFTQLAVTNSRRVKNYELPQVRLENEPPKVDIDILQGNKTFFFLDRPIQYTIRVVDGEDGSLTDGGISPDRVTVRMDYFSTRFDSTALLVRSPVVQESPAQALAQRLIIESDCRACHSLDKPGVGPTYERIAQKYKGDPGAIDRLARKIISGGKGVWGESTMSPHPQLSLPDASTIVTYILSLSEARSTATMLPVSGAYTPVLADEDSGDGYFRLWASYTDRGTQSKGPIRAGQVKFFRSPVLLPEQATWGKRVETAPAQNHTYDAIGPGSYLGYSQLDMTDIGQLAVNVKAPAKGTVPGGTIEVRLDSLTGKLIGKMSTDKPRLPPSTDSSPAKREGILVDLTPATGVHDLYFLFKNPQAAPQQVLMQIDALVLKPVTSNSGIR